jgi:hypothetical protein
MHWRAKEKERNIMRMKTLATLGVLLAAAAIAGCARSEGQDKKSVAPAKVNNAGTPRAEAAQNPGTSVAANALRRAAGENKYLFILFFSSDDEPTRLAKKSLEKVVRRIGSAAEWVAVDITTAREAEFANKYNVRLTPMPMALAFAPNGAVTGGFRSEDLGNEGKLRGAILSKGLQECLKALQERKMVFICVQGKKTQFNKEAMQGVDELKGDARYAAYTAIVKIDPADSAETNFLAQLKIDVHAKEAATAFLLPPNYMLGVTKGPTSKAAFLKLLASATSGGCGPKGCGPTGCGPVKK